MTSKHVHSALISYLKASSVRTMRHTAMTPPRISESLLLRRLIFCTRLFINGKRADRVKERTHFTVYNTRSRSQNNDRKFIWFQALTRNEYCIIPWLMLPHWLIWERPNIVCCWIPSIQHCGEDTGDSIHTASEASEHTPLMREVLLGCYGNAVRKMAVGQWATHTVSFICFSVWEQNHRLHVHEKGLGLLNAVGSIHT